MKIRKIGIIFILLIIVISVSACSSKATIDVPEGHYYYPNKDLGFSIVIPPEMENFQTQRNVIDHRTDIEFFVPTGDKAYYQEVSGYGKIMTVRVFERKTWELDETPDDATYTEIIKTENSVYSIKFWKKIPKDWDEKWSEKLKDKIINNFQVN